MQNLIFLKVSGNILCLILNVMHFVNLFMKCCGPDVLVGQEKLGGEKLFLIEEYTLTVEIKKSSTEERVKLKYQ